MSTKVWRGLWLVLIALICLLVAFYKLVGDLNKVWLTISLIAGIAAMLMAMDIIAVSGWKQYNSNRNHRSDPLFLSKLMLLVFGFFGFCLGISGIV